jgi:hypothetical protein
VLLAIATASAGVTALQFTHDVRVFCMQNFSLLLPTGTDFAKVITHY